MLGTKALQIHRPTENLIKTTEFSEFPPRREEQQKRKQISVHAMPTSNNKNKIPKFNTQSLVQFFLRAFCFYFDEKRIEFFCCRQQRHQSNPVNIIQMHVINYIHFTVLMESARGTGKKRKNEHDRSPASDQPLMYLPGTPTSLLSAK